MPLHAISTILEPYGLRATAPVTNLTTGPRSGNVRIETSAGPKVLKRYRHAWPTSSVRFSHVVLARLAEIAFPAPRVVSTAERDTLIRIDDVDYALFDFVDGVALSEQTGVPAGQRAASAGSTLGRLHRALDGFAPPGRHHLGFESAEGARTADERWTADRVASLVRRTSTVSRGPFRVDAAYLLAEASAAMRELQRLERDLDDRSLVRALIHGDFGDHNLLVDSAGTITVLDFELARFEWRLSDLALVVMRYEGRALDEFLRAYVSECPLSAEEWPQIADVWRLRTLQRAFRHWESAVATDTPPDFKRARRGLEASHPSGSAVLRVRELARRLPKQP
jgi:Ser/Thr protein kinase RdoA (MazF antagonist)